MSLSAGLILENDMILQNVRSAFQGIKSQDDIESINRVNVEEAEYDNRNVILAYQAAATCMKAKYVFSPVSKLKYFNRGKKELETLIENDKSVENIYLRLLIQLNVPRHLNYYREIDEDIIFLENHLAKAQIDLTYKRTMIKNLVSVADKKEIKDILVQIKLETS
ncbi:hypothetical protein [Lutimonas zeaxanthinifaciens]|uniref:hypothetical protein n=1 Tax=Lutimonas zeaxanthinifaciens TaxID=3060215 RepID=UPI00265D37E8|nr:hypothetical protein [Lutimonas sp. YSD2104]WKK65191.1 hypothetical protein QZH61_11435 [Lutimonas sp. YSD2104]